MNGQIVHTDEWGITHILSPEEAQERFGIVHETSAHVDARQKSYLEQLKPFHGAADGALMLGLRCEVKMVQSCSSPAVVFAIMASSIALGKLLICEKCLAANKDITGTGIAMSLTYSTILTTRFGWSEASVGLVNVRLTSRHCPLIQHLKLTTQ